jgi:pyridoxal phosphate enzyme (YggS family)
MTEATTESYTTRLTGALPAVRERIARASEASGRPEDAVRLVAVTKSHPLTAVEAAVAAGLTDLGENRVEELEQKVAAIGRGVTWHMIGHLQSRKASRAASVADVLHSVDSLRLASRLSQAASDDEREVVVLAQVNTSGESSKSGFDPDSATDEIARMAELPGLRVHGLMTMAPFVDDEVVLGGAFASLRRLGEELRASGHIGPELSMGMTNDLEIAIREGSTMVRIGTALFGERAR